MARKSRTSTSQIDLTEATSWYGGDLFSEMFFRAHRDKLRYESEEDMKSKYSAFLKLWTSVGCKLWETKEAEAREKFIGPMLKILGFGWLTEKALPSKNSPHIPDYILYGSEVAAINLLQSNVTEQYRLAHTFLEAKRFGAALDRKMDKEESGNFRYPFEQVNNYLSNCVGPDGTPFFKWAVLTNGHTWRLYNSRDSHPQSYFEVTLGRPNGDPIPSELFQLFLLFFGPTAFARDESGECQLDKWRRQSFDTRRGIENSLRRKAPALAGQIATAFCQFEENKISIDDADSRREVFDTSIIFLFRTLFILYAESRGLLPVSKSLYGKNDTYRRDFSLEALIDKVRHSGAYSESTTKLYDRLRDLFALIEGKNARQNKELDVTQFDGGLFDREDIVGARLDKWRIGDKQQALILRSLLFEDEISSPTGQTGLQFPEPIDFGSLEVRQLGDIYEGLLGGFLVKVEEGKSKRLAFKSSESEQQKFGAFYTPDWVVRVLVENTLAPKIASIRESADAQETEEQAREFYSNEVLKLSVLDPAIGSGHFLVRVTEWIADQLFLYKTGVPITGLDDLSDEEERAYWRRRVVENVVFGVDRNQLAVHLAKLSLWLTCLSPKKPLNFLDHHIKWANSLIFCSRERLARFPRSVEDPLDLAQLGLAQRLAIAVRELHEIESSPSVSIDQVDKKKKRFGELEASLVPFLNAAGFSLAASQDPKLTEDKFNEFITQTLDSKRKKGTTKTPLASEVSKEWAELEAHAPAMHWEFYFPEVYFDEHGKPLANAGFDAVVGNPPYVSLQKTSSEHDIKYVKYVMGPNDNLYGLFTMLALDKLKTGGRMGMIISDTFLTLSDKRDLRKLLRANRTEMIALCDPFEATVETAMVVTEKRSPAADHRVLIVDAQERTRSRELVERDSLLHLSDPSAKVSLQEWADRLPEADELKVNGSAFMVKRGNFGALPAFSVEYTLFDHSIREGIFLPTRQATELFRSIVAPAAKLVEQYFDIIQSSKAMDKSAHELSIYRAKLKPGDLTLVGLITTGGQGMRTANNGRFLAVLEDTKEGLKALARQAEFQKKWRSNPDLKAIFEKGLKASHGNFEDAVEIMKEQLSEGNLGMKGGEVYRVCKDDQIATADEWKEAFDARKDELLKLWAKSKELRDDYSKLKASLGDDFFGICRRLYELYGDKRAKYVRWGFRSPKEAYLDPNDAPRIAVIYNGINSYRCYLPFRKGDREGNRWLSDEPLYINWSYMNVEWLRTSPKARWQSMDLMLTEGCTYNNLANHTNLKARHSPICIFDANASRIGPIQGVMSVPTFLAILNGDVFSYVMKRFVKHTEAVEVNDLRIVPIVIPSNSQAKVLETLGNACVAAKRAEFDDGRLPPNVRKIADEWRERLYTSAPEYLHPGRQEELKLIKGPTEALAILERAISWEAEKLYGVEGKGPFNEW